MDEATSALAILVVHGLISTLVSLAAGYPIFPFQGSSFNAMAWNVLYEMPAAASAAIVAVRTILALTGEGREPTGWLDRACFPAGLAWIGWYLGHEALREALPP